MSNQWTQAILKAMVIVGAISVLLSCIISLFSPQGTILLMLASFAFFSVGGGAIYYCYRSEPKVKQRKFLMDGERKLHIECIEAGERITSLGKEKTRISNAHQSELSAKLADLQQRYVTEGMRSATVADEKIPGVGPKLKERLVASHITRASDISQARIASVQGFGESKVMAVVMWAESVRRKYEASKPVKLPDEIRETLNQKYDRMIADNASQQVTARNLLAKLEKDISAARASLEQFSQVSFLNYLRENAPVRLPGILAAIAPIVCVVLGITSQCAFSTASYLDSIPTRTPTLTSTLTPTVTPTSTSTSTHTATITMTPSRTPTPTKTPTITQTPTITLTPSITLTSTNTLIPTRTTRPTDTRMPTSTLKASAPGRSGGSSVCNCSMDYDCDNFSSHNAAQSCYDACGGNNWSRLDRDGDGIACESLP